MSYGILCPSQERAVIRDLPLSNVSVFRQMLWDKEAYLLSIHYNNEFGEEAKTDFIVDVRELMAPELEGAEEEYVQNIAYWRLAGDVVITRYAQWHLNEAGDEDLESYLGMTMQEYDTLVRTGEFPENWSLPDA